MHAHHLHARDDGDPTAPPSAPAPNRSRPSPFDVLDPVLDVSYGLLGRKVP